MIGSRDAVALPRPMRTSRVVRGVAVVLLSLSLTSIASPAAADPAGPTHYDSRLSGVTWADGSGEPVPVTLEVLGGDAFLVVRAEPGTEVEVPGYEDEPYVRIAADGTVEVNQRAPTHWYNDERYGTPAAEFPPDVDVTAPPRWEVVAAGGEYAWHDHRIHWMAPSLPRQVDPDAGAPQPVDAWTVPLVVDGEVVAVTGELWWLPGPASAVPIALVVVAVLAGTVLGLRRPGGAPAALGAAGVAALAVGASKNLGLPAGADGEPFLVVLPLLSLAAVVAGVALGRHDDATAGRGTLIATAGGIPLLVWATLQAGALTRPVVPGPFPVGLVRVVVAAAVATGVAGLVTAGRGALAATALDRHA